VSRESAPDLLERAVAVVGRLDWDTAVSDSVAALEYLRGRDQGVGVVDQIVKAVDTPENETYRCPGAGHAFDNPDNPPAAFHHAEASALAWQRTTAFLSLHLPTERGSR
jgi:carboxymethylenebutenolidase